MNESLDVRHCWRYLQLSVPSLWCNTLAVMTRSLLFGVTRCTLIQCCRDQRLCRLHCYAWMICQGFLCVPDLAQNQLQGIAPFLILSLSFRQCLCHSLLSSRIATSVLALCAHGSIHTERQHALQTLCCTVWQWQNVSSEWNAKERLFCVPLLLELCCSQCCVQLGFNELANTIYHPTHITFQTLRTCHLLSRRSFLMRFWIEMCRKVHLSLF